MERISSVSILAVSTGQGPNDAHSVPMQEIVCEPNTVAQFSAFFSDVMKLWLKGVRRLEKVFFLSFNATTA